MTQDEHMVSRIKIDRMIEEAEKQIAIYRIAKDNQKGTEKEITMNQINYERGMIRGLERALEMIDDIKEVTADYKAMQKRRA